MEKQVRSIRLNNYDEGHTTYNLDRIIKIVEFSSSHIRIHYSNDDEGVYLGGSDAINFGDYTPISRKCGRMGAWRKSRTQLLTDTGKKYSTSLGLPLGRSLA